MIADRGTATGVAATLGAFVSWGLFPLYFKALEAVPAVEILAHRVVWTVFVTAVLITGLRQWPRVATALGARRLVVTLVASATVISVNWGVFIWAIVADRILDASLGYYINPLVSVALGVIVLGERLRPVQWAALAVAAAGVGYAVVAAGTLPWVALTLAVSFGLYGLIRKVAAVGPLIGLFIETTLVAPVALGYLLWLGAAGEDHFIAAGLSTTLLLAAAGVVTATPLLLFITGTRRVQLSTVGLLQYLVPTMHFGLAVAVFGEPLDPDRLVVFGLIWAALALYSTEAVRRS